jgi:deoxyribodipyrimidine photo-lyase
MVFTRDLRVHDNPALHLACSRARQVVPLFVADPALCPPPNRARFLTESLTALREELRERGGDLVIRHGDPVAEVIRLADEVGASAIYIADDVSRYATRRREALTHECARHRLDLVCTPGLTVVPPGDLKPAGGEHYRVFTPYWRAWSATTWRPCYPAPPVIQVPHLLQAGHLPPCGNGSSPGLARGGERAGRLLFVSWRAAQLASYDDNHDDLAGAKTSGLSAYLRFGCVSPLEVAIGTGERPGGAEFCRQLAWRDFFYQVTAAFPDIAAKDYRPGAQDWRQDADALEAWRTGRTGIPIVDAGMRQLAAEGFMHNRARMITASFLTRNLRIDWREGYRHFGALLADADVANNAGNWQWVAGTGNNSRPNRVMNPLRQAQRFDKSGAFVRRYVPELAGVTPALLQIPWKLSPSDRSRLGYPAPIVELA